MNKNNPYDMSLWLNHRPLFTDEWNSFWHVAFGMMVV